MNKKLKLIVFVLLVFSSFVGLANTAVVWHGALFIVLLLPYGWAVNQWFDWARR